MSAVQELSLEAIAAGAVQLALDGGATGAECTISEGEEFSANVRMRELEQEVEHAGHDKVESAVFFIDLDQFKYINDTAGHAAGDQLLVEIGQQLSERLREADLLARIGSSLSLAAFGENLLPAQDARHVHHAVAEVNIHKNKPNPGIGFNHPDRILAAYGHRDGIPLFLQ